MSSKKHPGLPHFIAAVLTDDARQRLELAVGDFKFSNSTLKEEQYCQHVTLAFNPSLSDYEKIRKTAPEGTEVIIKCKKLCHSEEFGAEAMMVEVKNKDGETVFVQSGFPHITVSTEGKSPVAGKQLFEFSDEGYEGAKYIADLECKDFSHLVLDAIVSYKE